MKGMNRREFLKSSAACAGAVSVLGSADLAYGIGVSDKKFVFINLNGGADLMTLFPPHGDPGYAPARGNFAILSPNASSVPSGKVKANYLNDMFGMHPAMPELYQMFQRREMTLFHSVKHSNAATLSHFHEQFRLHNGMDVVNAQTASSGWMNRILTALTGENLPGAVAITGYAARPNIFKGQETTGVYVPPGTGIPTDMLALMQGAMGNTPIRQLLDAAIQRRVSTMAALSGHSIDNNVLMNGTWGFSVQAQVGALLLTAPPASAPAMVYHEIGGWDWHDNGSYHTGYVANRMANFSQGLNILVNTLKQANMFEKTLIVVTSEFGRAAAANGAGTDHAPAGFGMIITGNPALKPAAGSEIVGAWPGYASVNGENHLPPTSNFMNIMRTYIRAHFGMTQAEIDLVIPPIGIN